ncbi:hypothetical protein LTR05_004574 [Lithohypha guttulata]|uniref:Uncharacterized protein n=1 Tax=Lithohypha guttulata TaxID=1690604 RepID=A0AAN7SZX9_9EURO|nr:hypothetical protein LTR05_004574 [Lithohypha guttulata]
MPEFYVGSISKAIVLDAKQFSLRPFQLEKLPALRILELRNITVWCMFYDEVFLQSPQADEAMYDMTMFNVKRMSATLHELCRSSRSFKIHLCAQFVMSSLSDETIHAVISVDDRKIIRKTRGAGIGNLHSRDTKVEDGQSKEEELIDERPALRTIFSF